MEKSRSIPQTERVLAMNKSLWPILLLAVSLLACASPGWVPTVTPTSLPTVTGRATKLPTVTKSADSVTVTISQATVRIRQSPGGVPTGDYLHSGDRVQLTGECDADDWCPVQAEQGSRTIRGYVWRGCLAEVADGLLCLAKP